MATRKIILTIFSNQTLRLVWRKAKRNITREVIRYKRVETPENFIRTTHDLTVRIYHHPTMTNYWIYSSLFGLFGISLTYPNLLYIGLEVGQGFVNGAIYIVNGAFTCNLWF